MSEEKEKKKWLTFGNTLDSHRDACFYCGKSLNDYSRTVDHLIPKCDGGIKSNSNKVYSCKSCNQLKGNMHPEQFVEMLETMIRFNEMQHKKEQGYLKKVKRKTEQMIKHRKTKK